MMRSMLRMIKLSAMAFGVVALLLGGLFSWFSFQSWRNDRFQERFAFLSPIMGELNQIAASYHAPDELVVDVDWRSILETPKIVVITVESNGNQPFLQRVERRVDPLMLSFDKNWHPQSIDDVNLVIAVRWRQQLVGEYSDGARAYQESCSFTVKERGTGVLLMEGVAVGSMPPHVKSGKSNSDQYGGRADSQVVELITTEMNRLARIHAVAKSNQREAVPG